MKSYFPHFCYVNGFNCGIPLVGIAHSKGLFASLLVFLIMLGYSQDLAAQNGELRGSITDQKTGEPFLAPPSSWLILTLVRPPISKENMFSPIFPRIPITYELAS